MFLKKKRKKKENQAQRCPLVTEAGTTPTLSTTNMSVRLSKTQTQTHTYTAKET